jgi:8-oxo-dGTP diphosphatase
MFRCYFEDGHETTQLRHCCVDCVVTRAPDEVLMAKRTPSLKEGGKWGLIGGYMDRDEVITEAAHREIMEETGYNVEDLKLAKILSNPNRKGEDRQNVSLILFCHATEKTGEPDWESTEQRWFKLSELPAPDEIAFDYLDAIKLYAKYLDKPFPLPILA